MTKRSKRARAPIKKENLSANEEGRTNPSSNPPFNPPFHPPFKWKTDTWIAPEYRQSREDEESRRFRNRSPSDYMCRSRSRSRGRSRSPPPHTGWHRFERSRSRGIWRSPTHYPRRYWSRSRSRDQRRRSRSPIPRARRHQSRHSRSRSRDHRSREYWSRIPGRRSKSPIRRSRWHRSMSPPRRHPRGSRSHSRNQRHQPEDFRRWQRARNDYNDRDTQLPNYASELEKIIAIHRSTDNDGNRMWNPLHHLLLHDQYLEQQRLLRNQAPPGQQRGLQNQYPGQQQGLQRQDRGHQEMERSGVALKAVIVYI